MPPFTRTFSDDKIAKIAKNPPSRPDTQNDTIPIVPLDASDNPTTPPSFRKNDEASANRDDASMKLKLDTDASTKPCSTDSSTLQESLNYVVLRSSLSDADESLWPTPTSIVSQLNRAGVFRIDDPLLNSRCSKSERQRREQAMKRLKLKLGVGLADARDSRIRLNTTAKHIRTLPLAEQTVSSIGPIRKKRQSHRQIPKSPYTRRRFLFKLPPGVGVFQTRRESNAYDTYLIGCKAGWFDSTDSFIPHLDWIDCGMPQDEPCTCKQCSRRRPETRSSIEADSTPASAKRKHEEIEPNGYGEGGSSEQEKTRARKVRVGASEQENTSSSEAATHPMAPSDVKIEDEPRSQSSKRQILLSTNAQTGSRGRDRHPVTTVPEPNILSSFRTIQSRRFITRTPPSHPPHSTPTPLAPSFGPAHLRKGHDGSPLIPLGRDHTHTRQTLLAETSHAARQLVTPSSIPA